MRPLPVHITRNGQTYASKSSALLRRFAFFLARFFDACFAATVGPRASCNGSLITSNHLPLP